MSNEKRTLSYKELGEIDHLYSKANSIHDEARRQLQSYSFDLAVRRSQEAVELYIKTIFRLTGKEYPRSHDLEKTIYDISMLLGGYGVSREEVARMVLANTTMGLWRSPSFYGDEKLGVARLFRQKEGEVALAYADEVRGICDKVRSDLYQRAGRAAG